MGSYTRNAIITSCESGTLVENEWSQWSSVQGLVWYARDLGSSPRWIQFFSVNHTDADIYIYIYIYIYIHIYTYIYIYIPLLTSVKTIALLTTRKCVC